MKYRLFKTCCMSLHGILLCDLSSKHVKSLYTAWRKAVRRLCRIPYNMTHFDLLHLIVNDLPYNMQMHRSLTTFFISICRNRSQLISLCTRMCLNDSRPIVSKSLHHILLNYNIPPNVFSTNNTNVVFRIMQQSIPVQNAINVAHAGLIRDILQAIDSNSLCICDAQDIIEKVCCH